MLYIPSKVLYICSRHTATMRSFGVATFATLYFVLHVGAQIPKRCVENYNPDNPGECCPEAIVNGQSIGQCGSQAGRGKCVPVEQLCNTAYTNDTFTDALCKNIADERLNWPSKVFSHVCDCEEKYGDYDCGRCAYGYIEESGSCVIDLQPRRSITSLSKREWKDYLELLNTSKHVFSTRYVVIIEERQLRNITTYNLFTWLHHYAAKDHIFNYREMDSGKCKIIISSNKKRY